MRHTKTKVVPAVPAQPERTIEVDNGGECDICHAATTQDSYKAPFGETEKGNVHLVTVSLEIGYTYQDCGDVTTTHYDVCPACWARVIVPLFNNPPTVKKADW